MKPGFKLLVFSICLVIASALGLYFWSQRDVVITLNPRFIEEQVGTSFPFDRRLLGLLHFHLDAPQIRLPPNQTRIYADFQGYVALPLLQQKFHGSTTLSSEIIYRSNQGTFFLESPQVEAMSFEGVPPEQMQQLTQELQELGRLVLLSIPIYTLNTNDTQQNITHLFLKRVEIKDEKLQLILGVGD